MFLFEKLTNRNSTSRRYQRHADWTQVDNAASTGWVPHCFNVFHYIYLDVNSFNEDRLQAMFHGNYISGVDFNINLGPAKTSVESPDCGQSASIGDSSLSHSSHESPSWCYFATVRNVCVVISFIPLLYQQHWNWIYFFYYRKKKRFLGKETYVIFAFR